MNSQQLFYINIILGVFFIAYFVLGRSRQKSPTKLNLRAVSRPENLTENLPQNLPQISSSVNQSKQQIPEPKQSLLEPESLTGPQKASKQLSIFFMYNGHDWEAHEVLGIPQGASVEVATRAYQDQLKTTQPTSYEFLESAYNAIFTKRRNQKL